MNDPVKHCSVYKEIGCAHVDGYLCDYPDCSILKDYKMNERIRELVRRAVVAVDVVTGNEALDDELAKMYVPDCFSEKFAELIVRECQTVVEWAISVDSTIDRVPVLIKEHFGVEE
jgi:hypothetical protein